MRGADLIGRFSDNNLASAARMRVEICRSRRPFVNAVREGPSKPPPEGRDFGEGGGVAGASHARNVGEAIGHALEALESRKEAGRAPSALLLELEARRRRREKSPAPDVIRRPTQRPAGWNSPFRPVVHGAKPRSCLPRVPRAPARARAERRSTRSRS